MTRSLPRRRPPTALLPAVVLCAAAFLTLTSGYVGAAGASFAPPPGPAAATGFSSDAVPIPSGTHAVVLPPVEPVHLAVTLVPSHAEELAALDAALVDPTSPLYRHYLTESEFEQRYSPSTASVQAVESYFSAYGASGFATTADRLGVSFGLPAGGADAALGVTLEAYGRVGNRLLYTSVGSPRLPAGLAHVVAGVDGLSDGGVLQSSVKATQPLRPVPADRSDSNDFVVGLGGPQWFIGSDFTQATFTSSLFPVGVSVLNATFPRHEAVATILMSSYNSTLQTDLPPWDPSVIGQYFNDTLPSNWPAPTVLGVNVTLDGISAPAPGSFHDINDSSGDEIENSLDLEMAGSLAPGAVVANFYFAAQVYLGTSPGAYQPVADDFAYTLAKALDYNYTNATLAAVSNSYGLPDLNDSLWDEELTNAATTGVTVVAASGDQGDAPPALSGRFQGQWPTWPGTAALNTSGTIAVGGVSMTLVGNPTSTYQNGSSLIDGFDNSVAGIQSETAWYDVGTNISGTEGGASVVMPEPAWQRDSAAQPAIVNMTVAQGQSYLGRAEPDIAGPANDTIAYVLNYSGTLYFTVVEGTSIASPVVAGMLASLSAVAGHRFGFFDPELYRIGSFYSAFHVGGDPFESVTSGANYLFSASALPGWSPLTGWGTVNAVDLLAADANATIAGYQSPPGPGLPAATPHGSGAAPLSGDYLPILIAVGVLLTALVLVVIAVSARRARRPPVQAPPNYGPGSYPYAPPGPTAPSSYSYVYPPSSGPPLPSSGPPYPPPSGPGGGWGTGPPPSPPPFATFECPYCGQPRPAEAGRCPHCGAF